MNLINWCNSNQGFAMIVLTAVYAITTIAILCSSNKTLKLGTQQKEQARVIASLDLIRKLNAILNNPPVHKTDADSQKERLSLLQGEISALGGINAYTAYKKLYDFLSALSETTDTSVFDNITIKQELSKRYLKLESFFRSDIVAKQNILVKKKRFYNKLFKKVVIINLPLVETAFQYGWNEKTSRNGILGVPASKGQCAVTAMIIQDYFGGDIYKVKVDSESHYFNMIEKQIIDLTADQFFHEIDYKNKTIVNRSNFEQETMDRYYLLKSRVEPVLINVGILKRAAQ